MFSYQCSRLSTPQSVIDVFNTAKSFQNKQDTTQYVSVVVLDEVGLAEDSPLKELLEDYSVEVSLKSMIQVALFCDNVHAESGERKEGSFYWNL